MLFNLLLSAALAADVPAGFEKMRDDQGCTVYRGPVEPDGVQPMRAICHWPEVKPDALTAMLSDYSAYDKHIFAIQTSTVLSTTDGKSLVYQLQRAKGIAPREVLLWMHDEQDDGARRTVWTTANDVEHPLVEGHVRAPRNEGFWEVRRHPDGGALVVHHIAYDPGGTVPAFLVRWFQTGGMSQVMGDVRTAAAKASQ